MSGFDLYWASNLNPDRLEICIDSAPLSRNAHIAYHVVQGTHWPTECCEILARFLINLELPFHLFPSYQILTHAPLRL